MSILIVKRAALGDVVRATSLLDPLRRRWPGARLAWVTGPKAAPLLEGLGVEVVTLEQAAALPARSFQLVLSLEEDAACARLAARVCAGELVGVVERAGALGYTASSEPYYGMSLLRPAEAGGKAAADALKAANGVSWARLWCGVLGLDPGPCPVPALALGEAELADGRARAAGLARGAPLVGFSPWAAPDWPAKSLSPLAAAAAARAMAASGARVALLAGPEQAAMRAEAAALAAHPDVLDGGPADALRGYAALLAACDAVVSVDTLAGHLAAAAGVPCAVFAGPTAAAELDLGPQGFAVTAPGCACFYRAACARPPSCLERLPPAAYAEAAARLLAPASSFHA